MFCLPGSRSQPIERRASRVGTPFAASGAMVWRRDLAGILAARYSSPAKKRGPPGARLAIFSLVRHLANDEPRRSFPILSKL